MKCLRSVTLAVFLLVALLRPAAAEPGAETVGTMDVDAYDAILRVFHRSGFRLTTSTTPQGESTATFVLKFHDPDFEFSDPQGVLTIAVTLDRKGWKELERSFNRITTTWNRPIAEMVDHGVQPVIHDQAEPAKSIQLVAIDVGGTKFLKMRFVDPSPRWAKKRTPINEMSAYFSAGETDPLAGMLCRTIKHLGW